MKAFIVNDTTKNRNQLHFGCELVMQTYREQLDRVGIELIGSCRGNPYNIPKKIDIVIVNGEGTLHHGKFSSMIHIARHHPSILINTIWQENPTYQALKYFKYIAVRESLSYNALPPNLPNVKIVPDIIFTSSFLTSFKKPTAVKDFGITDNVTDKFTNDEYDSFSTCQSPYNYLINMSKYKRLCIGRFHSVIAASILRIPFSAWPSNTHKIYGMLLDMNMSELHFQNRLEALENIPTMFDEKIDLYVGKAQKKINQMFENIHKLI